MAGVSVEGGQSGGRRKTDSEINLIPMIDLFIVCISFLLITAVWSRMSRLNANAEVPGTPPDIIRTPEEAEKRLMVDMSQDDRFVLSWRTGATVHATADVPRKAIEVPAGEQGVLRYPDLAEAVARQWQEYGSHKNAADPERDSAILRVPNHTPYRDIIAVIDAVYQAKRKTPAGEASAFNVTFSSQ